MAKGKKTGGRQRGTVNQATLEAKATCAALVDDLAYQAVLRERLLAGTLPPVLEAMLWHYAKGKPSEKLTITTPEALEIVVRAPW